MNLKYHLFSLKNNNFMTKNIYDIKLMLLNLAIKIFKLIFNKLHIFNLL